MLRFLRDLLGRNDSIIKVNLTPLDLDIPDEALETEEGLARFLMERLPRASGGTGITEMRYDEERQSIIVTYENEGVAEKFLSNLIRMLREHDPEDRPGILTNFFNIQTEIMNEPRVEAGKIFPVLKHRLFHAEIVERLKHKAIRPATGFPHEIIAGNLVKLYVLDGEGSVTYVDDDMLSHLDISPGQLAELAMSNLNRHIAATGLQIHDYDDVRMLALDDMFEASVAFLDRFWNQQQQEWDAAPVAAFIARNVVAFTHADNVEGLRELDMLSRDTEDQAYAISEDHYIWTGEGWALHKAIAPQ